MLYSGFGVGQNWSIADMCRSKNTPPFWADYYLRWWSLPIEERACRKTDLGGGDYFLRNSGLPPSFKACHHS